jgi:tRNA threonylcarbamoyladenosine biosynthesis protein TsaE
MFKNGWRVRTRINTNSRSLLSKEKEPLQLTEFLLSSPEETFELGKKLGQEAHNNAIFCLFGPLGAGKTTFIKGLVEGATKIEGKKVVSPTFVLLNIYQNVYHFDLYRLKDENEFLALGFEEYLAGGGITCIEWSERIEKILAHFKVHKITLTPLNSTTRLATFSL